VSVDELFRIASASKQVRHDSGTILGQQGSVPAAIHIVLDGRVQACSTAGQPSTIEAPASIGFLEAMAGLPVQETTRAMGRVVTLALTADELRTLLADNTDLVSGLFATLAERANVPDRLVDSTQHARELGELATDGVTPIERVFALQYVPLFGRVSADEMKHLAGIASAVAIQQGAALFAESAPPALWLMLSGEVVLENTAGQPPQSAAGGQTIGWATTMAGRSLNRSARGVRSGVALKIDRDRLFELLGERPELLRQMFAGMFTSEVSAGQPV
jgi:CRP-like cAMP-binding protein